MDGNAINPGTKGQTRTKGQGQGQGYPLPPYVRDQNICFMVEIRAGASHKGKQVEKSGVFLPNCGKNGGKFPKTYIG